LLVEQLARGVSQQPAGTLLGVRQLPAWRARGQMTIHRTAFGGLQQIVGVGRK
jgi:hypothetical protein